MALWKTRIMEKARRWTTNCQGTQYARLPKASAAPLSPIPTGRARLEMGRGTPQRPGPSQMRRLRLPAARLAQIETDLAATIRFCELSPIHIHAQIVHVTQRLGRLVAEKMRSTVGPVDDPQLVEERKREVAEEVAAWLEEIPQFADGSARPRMCSAYGHGRAG